MENDSRFLEFWLGTLDGVGLKRTARWREKLTLEQIYGAGKEQLMSLYGMTEKIASRMTDEGERERARGQWNKLRERGISYMSYYEEEYPERLRQIYSPPKHLYWKGKFPAEGIISISIVGARDCTCYGRDMARMFGYRLARAGVNVISGMARGIDGWAHQGALESGGDTFAVLGCGVEVCYPAEHQNLYRSIGRRGGLISELPPFMRAKSNFFPLRNRIISGLSDGILVVEARERSGSLITADAALDQGKDVFVVPGRIGDALSVGCNRLIRQGAVPVLSPDDILEYYGLSDTTIIEEKISSLAEKILDILGSMPVHRNRIVSEAGGDATAVMKELLSLKERGRIEEVSQGYFMRREGFEKGTDAPICE